MAVLLSPMSAIPHLQHHMTGAHGQSVPSDLSHNQSNVGPQPASKRPKLSLQTSSLASTYGSLTRGVAPNTAQAAYTPTTVNTLANTWDLTIRPSPISRTESPRPPQLTRVQTGQQPYVVSLPFGIKPILKNSPLPRATSVSASPRDSRRKVFFPQPKRVTFRNHLEEQIETQQYIAKHSDLTSSEEEEESSDEEQQQSEPSTPNTSDNPSTTTIGYHTSPPPCRKRKIRRDSGIYVDTTTTTSTQTPQPAAPTVTPTIPEDSADTSTPSTCKRRKSQSSPYPSQPEGAALRANAAKSEAVEDSEHPSITGTATSLQVSNDDHQTKERGEVVDEQKDASSPPRNAKSSAPKNGALVLGCETTTCPETAGVTTGPGPLLASGDGE